jgi:alpha-tubulin suppressor-like RCC1 family protein
LYAISASKALQSSRNHRAEQSWWSWAFGTNPGVDFLELKAEGGLKRGEKWTGISAGTNHLLAVTSTGRTFSLPLSPLANSNRQLGTRQMFTSELRDIPPEADPRFSPTLTEIPSLTGIQIAQVATSDRSSFVRTSTGRVLGFGANEAGQIGLGSNAAVETVQVPVEVVLAKGYPGGTHLSCSDIKAGGTTTFFTVERSSPGKEGSFVDLLACGSGITGALGNGLWSSANGTPSKVKT